MSCGRPHATACDEVLDHLYEYIDGELASVDTCRLRQHLEECGPCLRELGIEEEVRSIVRRSCTEVAPEGLRLRVLARIIEVRVELTPSE